MVLGLLRRLCSLIASLFVRAPVSSSQSKPEPEGSETQTNWSGWNEESQWEPFTVEVIPNDEPPREPDLFGDMEPVFKKPTMVSSGLY